MPPLRGRPEYIEIINVRYFRHTASQLTHNRNNVETAGVINLSILDVVIHSKPQMMPLFGIYSLQRVTEVPVAASLYFYKDYGFAVLCNNVDVAVNRMPVTLQNDVALLSQIGSSKFLTPDTQLEMLWSFGRLFLAFLILADQRLTLLESASYPSFLVGNAGKHSLKGHEYLFRLVSLPFFNTFLQHISCRPEHSERCIRALIRSIQLTDSLVSLFYSALFTQTKHFIDGHRLMITVEQGIDLGAGLSHELTILRAVWVERTVGKGGLQRCPLAEKLLGAG